MPSLSDIFGNRFIKWAVVTIVAAAAALSLYQGAQNALRFSQDFQWDAAKALCMRLDPYELSIKPQKALQYPELERFYRMFTDKGLKQKMEANQFPSLLLLLGPMTLFGPQTAKAVWLVLNLAFTAGIVILLRKTFFEKTDGYIYAVIALLMIAGTPYRNQLGVGQHTLFAFFFFMLAVYFDMHPLAGRGLFNGTVITLSLCVSYFKYTLTAPLALYFLYRKRYREFASSVGIHIILTAGCALWLQKSMIYMITAPLKVASALLAEGGIDLGAFFPGPVAYGIAFVAAALLTYIALRLPSGHQSELFALLIMWSLVLVYHRTYDFFVLSAVAALFADGADQGMTGSGGKISHVCYCVLIVLVYFILRIFDENMASVTATAVFYYTYLGYLTYQVLRQVKVFGSTGV